MFSKSPFRKLPSVWPASSPSIEISSAFSKLCVLCCSRQSRRTARSRPPAEPRRAWPPSARGKALRRARLREAPPPPTLTGRRPWLPGTRTLRRRMVCRKKPWQVLPMDLALTTLPPCAERPIVAGRHGCDDFCPSQRPSTGPTRAFRRTGSTAVWTAPGLGSCQQLATFATGL